MAFCWAITTENLLRSTWGKAHVESVSSSQLGFSADNAIDGNSVSRWRATTDTGEIVIDTASDNIDYDYIFCQFDLNNIPTLVSIATSTQPSSGFTNIVNNLDGSVTTTTTALLSSVSRIVPVSNTDNFVVGNIVKIADNEMPARTFTVVNVGSNYLEIDRFPLPYKSGALVIVVPHTNCLAYVAPPERKRYIRFSISCPERAHALELCAFKVKYLFDGDILPLNPYPAEYSFDVGQINRTFSGYTIGRMFAFPPQKRLGITMPVVSEACVELFNQLSCKGRFGLLTDDVRWFELLITNLSWNRRQSSNSSLVQYNINVIMETV